MRRKDSVIVFSMHVLFLLSFSFSVQHIVSSLDCVETLYRTLQRGDLRSEVSFARQLLLNF